MRSLVLSVGTMFLLVFWSAILYETTGRGHWGESFLFLIIFVVPKLFKIPETVGEFSLQGVVGVSPFSQFWSSTLSKILTNKEAQIRVH